jgi:hypothetical protein
MQVFCSCPNYEEQDLSTTESGWRILYVCKHLKAALDSVCDDDNDDDEEEVENATPGTAVHYEFAQCHPPF